MREVNDILNKSVEFDLFRNSIFMSYWGSETHGTSLQNKSSIDDIDIFGVVIPPPEYFFSLRSVYPVNRGNGYDVRFETLDKKEGKYDVVIHDFRKFMKLLAGSNPTMIQMLWMPEKYIIRQGADYKLLRYYRDKFITQRIGGSFKGIAMKAKDDINKGMYQGYMGEKRKALFDKHGYDTKNAQHAVRLLKMGIEALTERTINVDRQGLDASTLIEIKQGKWNKDRVVSHIDYLLERLEEARVESKSGPNPLPVSVDDGFVDDITTYILGRHFKQYPIGDDFHFLTGKDKE